MLLEEVKAKDALLVGLSYWTRRLQEIVDLRKVVKTDLEARVYDRVDVIQVLGQLCRTIGRKEGAPEHGV